MIRRFLTRILIAVLVAACVYNWMQTQRLQDQVAALEAKAAQPAMQTAAAPARAPEANFHLAHFRLYFLQGQWKHLQNRAGILRSTSKKVLSYVKL